MTLDGNNDSELPDPSALDEFMYFLDKYVALIVGVRELNTFFRNEPEKTLLDKLTPSDIAYGILVYENSMDVWEEEAGTLDQTTEERSRREILQGMERTAQVRYHWPKGKRIPFGWDGWTREGRIYYDKLAQEQKQLYEKHLHLLREAWRLYEAKVRGERTVTAPSIVSDFYQDWDPNNVGEVEIPE